MEKIEMIPDEGLGRLVKTSSLLAPTEIKVKLKSKELTKKILEAKGGESSPLGMEDVKNKFRACAGRSLSSKAVEEIADMVSSIESLPSVSSLTGKLSGE